MFRCPGAGLPSSFRRRPARCPVPPEAPPRLRLRVGLVLVVAGASAAGVLGCSDSFWEPPVPSEVDAWALAPIVSQTWLSADIDSLPPWEAVIQGLGGPACEFYFGLATGSYVSRKYVLDFSAEAKGDTDEVWVQQHQVLVTVKRPTSDGTVEVLPERVAVLAVCLHPGTERGRQETTGSVKAILKDMGIPLPDKMWASARPSGGGPWAALRKLASGWVVPSPLLAAQDADPCSDPEPSTVCEPVKMRELNAITERTCPVGFDYDVVEDNCNLNFVGEGMEKEYLIPVGSIENTLGLGGTRGNGGDGDDGDEGDRPVAFNLNCSSPLRGSTGGCYATTTDTAVRLSDLNYAWVTGAGVARPADTEEDFTSWEGTAMSTISMTVSISGPEVADTTLTGVVQVTAREWTWGDSVVNANFTFSSLDSCFPAGAVAAAMPANCAANWVQSSYTPGAGDGPWTGVEYIADASAAIDVEWAYDREFRSDGPHYAMRGDTALLNSCPPTLATMNVLKANTACSAASDFNRLLAFAAGHEGHHISAIEAEAGQHDLLADWEPVAGSASHVRTEAGRIVTGIEGAIHGAANWTHTPGPTYDVWWWDGRNGWQLLPIPVQN